MAKVGRASRNSSLMRVETLGDGTSAPTAKVIGDAETGEVYFIDHNHASALTITLPALKAGAYFKFIFVTAMSDNTATVVIDSKDQTNGDMVGTVLETTTHATDGAMATETAGAHHKLTIGSANDTSVGSWVECVCNGSAWIVTGNIIAAAVGNAAFGT